MPTIQPDDVGEACQCKKAKSIAFGLCRGCAIEYGYTSEEIDSEQLKCAGAQCSRCKQMVPLTTHGVCAGCSTCSGCSLRRVEPGRELCQVCDMRARRSVAAGAPVAASVIATAPDLIGQLESNTGLSADEYREQQERRNAANADAIKEALDRSKREFAETLRRRDFESRERLAQLALPIAERGVADLIRDRAALWSRRSDKWHKILNRERAWTWRGVALPGVVGAVCALAVVLDALKVLHVPAAAAWPAIGAVITALISLRANAARVQLDAGIAEQAWIVADRMAEHYRGLVAHTHAVESRHVGEDLQMMLSGAFMESQKIEAAARFGLPDHFVEVLREVTR